jgi:hypothetical protein
MNWTQQTCQGLAPIFKERPCENYSTPPPQCSLLKEKAITRICETGRCTLSMIGLVQEKLSEKFSRLDAREDFDLGKLIDRLKRVVWKDSSHPAGWLVFLHEAVRRMTIRALVGKGLVPERRNCGTCLNLTDSKPYTCQVSAQAKKKKERACDDYRFPTVTLIYGSDDADQDREEKSEANFFSTAVEKSEENQRYIDGRMDVESLRLELAKRVEAEEKGTKRRAKFARQYDLFVNLHRLLGEVDSDKKAFRILSQQLGVDQKTVRRDLAAIRIFLSSRFQ